jgi:DNA polymerase-3 subunit beta
MKFKVIKSEFIDKLNRVASLIGSRTTLPVLYNVMVEASNGKIILTSSDLEIRITASLNAEIETEGKTTLPAKTLVSMIKGLTGKEIFMESNPETHHMKINCEKSSYNLYGLPPDDFPLPEQFSPVRRTVVKQDELVRMLNRIAYAASSDDSRKNLNGVLFSINEGIFTVVATDGKRLALVEKTAESFSGDDGQVIVPSKTIVEIQRLFSGGNEDVIIEFGENQASFTMDGRTLTSKLVEGNYPNFRQVIPTSFTKKIEIPKQTFSSALQRIINVVSDNNVHVLLFFGDNAIKMKAASTEIGEGEETVDIEYNGDLITASFNPVFLLDPFKHLDADSITMQLNDGFNPIALSSGDGFLYVIMPMRNKES